MIVIGIEDPSSEAARYCIDSYYAELDARFDDGFDPALTAAVEAEEMVEPAGLLLVARCVDEPVGCGALKLPAGQPAEIKRLWVHRSTRGLGVGRQLMAELERHARERAASVVRLDTNRSLTEAINLYRSTGYVEIDAFNDEYFAHHWFEKNLSRAVSDTA